MKKYLLTILVFTSFISANAQSYLGYTHDNYAGVQGVLFNPASIVDSRFKTDINLFSMSSFASNDAYGVKLFESFKSDYEFDTEARKSFSLNNNAVVNTDVMGPSFMFNIAPKHSLAIYTRARAIVNVLKFNGNVIDELAKDNTNDFDYSIGSPNAVGNSWGELGLSYAKVLFQQGSHFIKGGVTAKYLQGVANYHFQADGVQLKFVENTVNQQNSQYTSTGTALYGSSQDFTTNSTVDIDSKSRGFGFDLGLVYEWRPDYDVSRVNTDNIKEVNKYKVRFGLSLTDLGSMNYEKGIRNTYDLNKTITQADVDNADDFDQFLKDNYAATVVNGAVKAYLPTAVHADVDWNIHNKFYLNLNGDLSVVNKDKLNQNSIENRISMTARFESRWFSCYVPISYMNYNKQAQVGVGLRTGIFFIGSGSVVTNLISSNSRAVDFHLGIKVPVYQKKKSELAATKEEDKDSDGVLDAADACPEVAGPVENNGCPWKDTDGDSVLDKDDACVDVAGPVENKGCPELDSDNDGIADKDDSCPTVAGPKENNGCPWADTDGDGIADKDDKCPSVKGTVSNNGCPEVTAEVIKQLNTFSKAILFNSGKSTIRPESNVKLEEIVNVMKGYTSANFMLEGYTDSTGSAVKNLQLSKERAAAVKEYLIAKGISADRLSSEGYGIVKPIASNKTETGRAQNRRVEILLAK